MSQDFQACPNVGLNNGNCTCPKTDCANHGICCKCVQNHLGLNNLPRCLRGVNKE